MLGSCGPAAYMLDTWNYLDIVVLLSSYLNMLAVSSDDSPLAMLRILRAFRPLRIVSLSFNSQTFSLVFESALVQVRRNQGMSMIMESIASSVPAMSNVLFLMLGALVILAIAGVAFFMGKFQHCNDMSNSFVRGSFKVNCHSVTSVEGYWTPTLRASSHSTLRASSHSTTSQQQFSPYSRYSSA